MSHFTVLVIHSPDEDLDELLEPYNENRQVEPYRSDIDAEEVQRALDYFLAAEDEPSKHELAQKAKDGDIAAACQLLKAWEGDEVFHDETGYYRMSTYNPDSKWDWWSVGGRWSDYFTIKPECLHDPAVRRGQPSLLMEYSPEFGKADSAPKRCIDIEGMRAARGGKAAEAYDRMAKLMAEHPGYQPWSSFLARRDAGEITIDEARQLYHAQPLYKAYTTDAEVNGWDLDTFLVSREAFVARARASALPGFAVLHGGQWISPGQMGWFGVSTATDSSRGGYYEHVNGLIDTADDEQIFTIVDCHI